MGVVIDSPLKNKSMLNATPNRALMPNCRKSFLSVISFLTKIAWNIKIQMAATETRIKINANGFTYSGITCLAMVNVAP
jgi:hypothetical protein